MMGLTIGLLGGGQLGQMLILAGLPLGISFVFGIQILKVLPVSFLPDIFVNLTIQEKHWRNSPGIPTWSPMNSRIFLILWLRN